MDSKQVNLTKDRENGMVAGVCAGIGRYFGIDTTLVRAVFVAALVMSGFGAILYIVLWIMMDEEQPEPPGRPAVPVFTDTVADPVPTVDGATVPDDLGLSEAVDASADDLIDAPED